MAKTKKSMTQHLVNFRHPDQFGNWLGYQMLKFDRKGRCAQTELKIREDHLSPAGRVHGGVISAFFDFSSGAAVFTTLGDADYCSTIELKVNYLLPIELGDHLTCSTQVVFRGKRLCVIQGQVYRKNQEAPVAVGLATFNVVVASPTPAARKSRS